MSGARPLSSWLISGVSDVDLADSLRQDPSLEGELASFFGEAAAEWPEFSVRPEALFPYIGARAVLGSPLPLRSDMYLACACSLGDRAAIAAVSIRWLGDIRRSVLKAGVAEDRADDVMQRLTEEWFVSTAVRPAKINEYSGRGDLRGWFRISATRAALKVHRKDKQEGLVSDDAVFEARASADDPELAYVKAHYREEFKAAFQQALDELPPKDRLLLKQHTVDGLSIDELSGLHGAHRATCARWLGSAREELLKQTRKHFMVRARISEGECESVLRLVRSQLDLSIKRRLSS